MIVCPVCEHAQGGGAECEVCGKRLLDGSAAIPAVTPVEGLEPTMHDGVDAAVERVAGLEPTRLGAVADVPADATPDIEATALPPVDVATEPVPELEPTRSADAEPRTEVPAFVVCRYCRTPAMPGEVSCSHCGMRLPSFARAPEVAEAAPATCSCGTPVRSGRCPSCGARVA